MGSWETTNWPSEVCRAGCPLRPRRWARFPYAESLITTKVGLGMHDLRQTVYSPHPAAFAFPRPDPHWRPDYTGHSDIDAVQSFITSGLLGALINSLTLIGMVGVMFYLNWQFTLIALSVAPALFFVVYRFTRRIKKASRKVREKESEIVSVIEEVFSSIRVVKATREDYEQKP